MKSSAFSKVPFYKPPPRKTSAEIINEARLAIRESQMEESSFIPTSIKPLQTQRPFTPRNKERHLFGKSNPNRPPSSFSLRYLQNEAESTPNSQPPDPNLILNPQLLSTITSTPKSGIPKQRSRSFSETDQDKIFNIKVQELSLSKVRLPSLKPLHRRKVMRNTSLDYLPEEQEDAGEQRKAFSSPQERTDFCASSKQKDLSECLVLGPRNLEKLFDNKQIIESSETLFTATAERMKRRSVEDVIDDLNEESGRTSNEERVTELMDELYDAMEAENLMAKVASKLKIRILKALYKFVESQDDKLLLAIARVILGLKVTGNNLSGVCKLMFKVSKNDKNDYLFFQKNILELFLDALGRSSPLDDAEACVYGYGSVKFLTMNPKLLNNILSLGILQLMVLHIKLIINAKMDNETLPEQTNHALYQLTGALRNIVSEESVYETFISCGAIHQLCETMSLFLADSDIISNISRILSIISTNDCCCDNIVENKNVFKTFVQLFDKYRESEEIVVRLAFTLGNIVAKIDNTRVKFYNEDKSIDTLLNLWKIYLERTLKTWSLKTDNESVASGNPEDVMIKVIRVIANIVINPEIGESVNETYGSLLIDEFLKVLISNPFKKNEELVLSILSTLNNLSYYYTNDTEGHVFNDKHIQVVEAISEYCKSKNKECLTEAIRILGNLSRSKETREIITSSEMFDVLLNTMDQAEDLLLLKTTVGVIVNLMSDNKNRRLFKKSQGMAKLIEILKNCGQSDWLLSMLVCQAVWNYTIDTVDLYELITDEELQDLLCVLADYLDEEKLFGITEHLEGAEILVPQEYLIWEEFASVATNLLEKIEYFLETFDQIDVEQDTVMIRKSNSSANLSFLAW